MRLMNLGVDLFLVSELLFTCMFFARVLKHLHNYLKSHHTLVRMRFLLLELDRYFSIAVVVLFEALRMVGSTYTIAAELDTQITSMVCAPTFVDFTMHAVSPRSLELWSPSVEQEQGVEAKHKKVRGRERQIQQART